MKIWKVYVAIPVHEIDCTWYQYEEYSGVAHTKYKNAKDELRKALSIKNRTFQFGSIRSEEVDEEVWNGMHGQTIAPAGTFEKIYNECEEVDTNV